MQPSKRLQISGSTCIFANHQSLKNYASVLERSEAFACS